VVEWAGGLDEQTATTSARATREGNRRWEGGGGWHGLTDRPTSLSCYSTNLHVTPLHLLQPSPRFWLALLKTPTPKKKRWSIAHLFLPLRVHSFCCSLHLFSVWPCLLWLSLINRKWAMSCYSLLPFSPFPFLPSVRTSLIILRNLPTKPTHPKKK
jgi:hypothetical protein